MIEAEPFIDYIISLHGLVGVVVVDVTTVSIIATWGAVNEPITVLKEIGAIAVAKHRLFTAINNAADRDNPTHEGLFFQENTIHVVRSLYREEFKIVMYAVFNKRQTNMATVRLAVNRFAELM